MANTATDALLVDLQVACPAPELPSVKDIHQLLQSAVRENGLPVGGEVSVRVVDEDEMSALNRSYRGKNQPTNVLAFPAALDTLPGLPAEDAQFLGDLVICAPVVLREATEQGKPVASHWAHMLVHGLLHLLGHDHESDAEAERMEALEIRVLDHCGIENPYRIKQLN